MQTRLIQAAGGIQLNCQLSGADGAQPMVLLHGLGEQAENWKSVEPGFAARFRVVALDLRGHGASDWPGRYSYELMRDDVLAVLDALDLHDIVLVGHSMGGVVAYLVAQAQSGRIARLVIEDAPPPFPRSRPIPERPDVELPFDWLALEAVLGATDDPSRRWWPHLTEITAPTLIIGGGPESQIPQDLLVEVSHAIADCTLVTIPVGHHIHDTAPEEFSTAVLTWLSNGAARV